MTIINGQPAGVTVIALCAFRSSAILYSMCEWVICLCFFGLFNLSMVISRFICVVTNYSISLYLPHFLCPVIHFWVLRLIMCLGHWEFCFSKHVSVDIFFGMLVLVPLDIYPEVRSYTNQHSHQECPSFLVSKSLPIVLFYLFDKVNYDRYEVLSHCNFNFHFHNE